MHPLHTLMQTQKGIHAASEPAHRANSSETEENAIVQTRTQRRSRVAVAVALITNRLTGR